MQWTVYPYSKERHIFRETKFNAPHIKQQKRANFSLPIDDGR